MKKALPVAFSVIGLLGCFFPFIIDMLSSDARHPDFSYWIASLFRNIPPATKITTIDTVSKFFFVASIIILVSYVVFFLFWFFKKTNKPSDYTLFKSTTYPVSWLVSFFIAFTLQVISWFVYTNNVIKFNGNGFAYVLISLFAMNIIVFIFLPLSKLFPRHYSNLPFLSSKN